MELVRTSRLFLSVLIAVGVAHTGFTEETSPENDPSEAGEIKPQERPRLFRPTDLHPYATPDAIYLDPWFYGSHQFPYYSYSRYAYGWNGFGSPLGYGYGFGYHSHLYYDTFYGMMPAPGHSELSISVGSNDYFGSSISTTQYLSKKHNIALNIAALWETGEQWWDDQDYESFTIAPTLYWSNEDTLIYLGFQYSERNYADAASHTSSQMQRPQLSSLDSDSNMSPFKDQIATNTKERANLKPGFAWHTNTDHTVKSATIGIDHQITDSFRVGFNFETRDFDRKRD